MTKPEAFRKIAALLLEVATLIETYDSPSAAAQCRMLAFTWVDLARALSESEGTVQ